MAPSLPLCRLFSTRCSAQSKASGLLRVVPREKLFVSEPDPEWFGNEPNPEPDAAEGWITENWLQSRFHFSFAEYDTGPPSFGVLQVMNDDMVMPMRGFGTHPHRDMEIITFVVEGQLTHKDSMLGEDETLERGSIQFMSAGSGVRHSEHNWHRSQPLRFIQSWVTPRKRGLCPNYGSMPGDTAAAQARSGKWAHLVSDVKSRCKTPVQINQDCNVYVTELAPSTSPGNFELSAGRQAYLVCIEGDARLLKGETALRQRDAAELKGPLTLDWLAGESGALLLLFEMAQTEDGRSDL